MDSGSDAKSESRDSYVHLRSTNVGKFLNASLPSPAMSKIARRKARPVWRRETLKLNLPGDAESASVFYQNRQLLLQLAYMEWGCP